jgi:hypothetical protein
VQDGLDWQHQVCHMLDSQYGAQFGCLATRLPSTCVCAESQKKSASELGTLVSRMRTHATMPPIIWSTLHALFVVCRTAWQAKPCSHLLRHPTYLHLKPANISSSRSRDPLGLPAVAHPGNNLQLQIRRDTTRQHRRMPAVKDRIESIVSVLLLYGGELKRQALWCMIHPQLQQAYACAQGGNNVHARRGRQQASRLHMEGCALPYPLCE